MLPVVDLASRLGLPPREPGARHAVIVVQHGGQVVGLLVDAVSNILTLSPDAVQSPPEVASDLSRAFVKGMVAIDKEVISVLVLKNLIPEATSCVEGPKEKLTA